MNDFLRAIVERKRREVWRRQRFTAVVERAAKPPLPADPVDALRRPFGAALRTLAEIKFRSPSAGVLRERSASEVARIARAYVEGGAAAISVLADAQGFGGSVLDVRRVAAMVRVPVLFKEFVIDDVQIDVARAAGSSMVLLLASVLDDSELEHLTAKVLAAGMQPLVEVATGVELDRGLRTPAVLLGVNARDLHTFHVRPDEARRLVAQIPSDRVAIYMSGVSNERDFAEVARGRADAVLIGEALMRAPDPGDKLRKILSGR